MQEACWRVPMLAGWLPKKPADDAPIKNKGLHAAYVFIFFRSHRDLRNALKDWGGRSFINAASEDERWRALWEEFQTWRVTSQDLASKCCKQDVSVPPPKYPLCEFWACQLTHRLTGLEAFLSRP